MSQIRFNQAFIGLLAAGAISSLVIPPSITGRAQGKADVLLYPVVKPVRAIADSLNSKYADRPLPPGETRQRNDSEIAAENTLLRQQITFLNTQLEDLRLVEAERKRVGKLLDYFKPVGVIGGDAGPGRESLSILPASGIDTSPGTPVMCSDGLVGRIVEGGRVRLITDGGFTMTGQFGRWENGNWNTLAIPNPSVKGAGAGQMRVENLTVEQAQPLKPGDWVVISDADFPRILQGGQIGQVDSIAPMRSKPKFAEIIVKPRTDLRKLREVLVLRK